MPVNPRLPAPFDTWRAFCYRNFTWGRPPPPCADGTDSSDDEGKGVCNEDECSSSSDSDLVTEPAVHPLTVRPSTICRLTKQQREEYEAKQAYEQQCRQERTGPSFAQLLEMTPPPVIARSQGRFMSTARYAQRRPYRRH